MHRFSIAACACALAISQAALAADFELFVTQTPPGIASPFISPDRWQGVLRYNIAGSGGAASALPGIPSNQLSDPAGLALRADGELLVGNRHGNSSPSSVSRFTLDTNTNTYLPGSTITGNNLFGTPETNINPTTGELFAANFGGGVSRFTFDGVGNASPNGSIGTGSFRGATAVGQRLYATLASNILQVYDLSGNSLLSNYAVPGASGLHYFGWGPGGDLYVADYTGNGVHRISFDASDNPTYKGFIASNAAIDVDFSPDKTEMFVAGHTTGLISRFTYNANTDSWIPSGSIDTQTPGLGALLVTPEPTTGLLLVAGTFLLSRRRRTN